LKPGWIRLPQSPGFDLRKIHCYRKAEQLGIGTLELRQIKVVGEKIEDVKIPFKLDFSLKAHQEMLRYPIKLKLGKK